MMNVIFCFYSYIQKCFSFFKIIPRCNLMFFSSVASYEILMASSSALYLQRKWGSILLSNFSSGCTNNLEVELRLNPQSTTF